MNLRLCCIQVCVQAVKHLSNGLDVGEDQLLTLCQLPDHDANSQLYTKVQKLLDPMGYDPVVAQLTLEGSQFKEDISLEQLFMNAKMKDTPEVHFDSIICIKHICSYTDTMHVKCYRECLLLVINAPECSSYTVVLLVY